MFSRPRNLCTILATLFVMGVAVDRVRADDPLHQRIDRAIAAKCMEPFARQTNDAEFIRRVYLDFAGRIPDAAEARAFLADKDPLKRSRVIDRLLASPEYPRRMQQIITVWLLERRPGQTITDLAWNGYVQEACAANKPWDAMIRDLIAADGKEDKHRSAMRFFADGDRTDPHQLTKDVARLFLGMNYSCCQCHDDPNIEDFKQADYFGLYAYLRQTQVKADKTQKSFLIETVAVDKQEFQSVFTNIKGATGPRLPRGMEVAIPKFEKGMELDSPAQNGLPGTPRFRPREMLATHLTAPANARFARNSVNYLWFVLMGRGLVHPLDMMHGANPPSHPELLDALAGEFVKNRYDLKHILREIALSEAYQRSSVLPDGVEAATIPPDRYRVAIPRPLSAEQLAFSVMQATGQLQRIVARPSSKDSKFTYKDYVNGRIPTPDNLSDVLSLFAATFGSPPGNSESVFTPSTSQALFLMNDKLVMEWLDPKAANLIVQLRKQSDARSVAVELYQNVLVRPPTAEETATVEGYLQKHPSRRDAALSELAWALITSAEFRFNH